MNRLQAVKTALLIVILAEEIKRAEYRKKPTIKIGSKSLEDILKENRAIVF
ncbi:hypothetical protein [Macrococcoides caseolyticum]|uniref:hypothetical protein n=1 Tax=Macrococcoides caseolyticum TaxID=69966 RepID=UPI0024BCA754|nr:hypothetical protein [Macrococcus caseolyticus]MDJ1088028.1 hypothetical protein [Macrococcus caseolyticus]